MPACANEINHVQPNTSPTTATDNNFKEVPYRWVVVVLYSLLAISIGASTVVLAPIATKLVVVYQVTDFTLNAIAMAYLLLFALIGIPANYFIDDHGLRIGLIIGCAFQSVGCSLQMCINISFYMALVGFVLVGVAQPFILNCIAKVAAFWFRKESRTMVCSVLTLLNLVGTGLGFILPTMFVSEDLSIQDSKIAAFNLMLTEAVPIFILTVLVIFLMKDKPDIAPSLGGQTTKIPFKDSVKILARNLNFMLVFFGFSMYYGPLATLSSLLNFLFKPFSFTDMQIAILGAVVIASGLIGAVGFSCYISRSNKFAAVLKSLSIVSIMLLSTGLVGLKFGFPFWSFIVIFSLLGILVTPLYALSYDLGCETSFPVGEAQVTGILNAGGNIFAFMLILIIQTSIGFGTAEQSITSFIVLLSIAIAGTVCFIFVKNILLRMEAERKHYEQDSGNSQELATVGINGTSNQVLANTALENPTENGMPRAGSIVREDGIQIPPLNDI